MNIQVKKNIKLLCEKFLHDWNYDKEDLLICNSVNEIRITHLMKNIFQIKYNCLLETDAINLEEDEIYDVLIKIFRRDKKEKISKSEGEVITLEVFKSEEYFSDKEVKTLFEELQQFEGDHKDIGGNRILYEYYKGLLMLKDDLCYFKSNVINIQ